MTSRAAVAGPPVDVAALLAGAARESPCHRELARSKQPARVEVEVVDELPSRIAP